MTAGRHRLIPAMTTTVSDLDVTIRSVVMLKSIDCFIVMLKNKVNVYAVGAFCLHQTSQLLFADY